MSAFMLSKEHIDLMVSLAVQGPRGVRPSMWHAPYFNGFSVHFENADALGEMLVKENLSSIHTQSGNDPKHGNIARDCGTH